MYLPDDFWEARPELGHIRRAAFARAICPDALLAVTLARLSAAQPPARRVDSPLGHASLNSYAAIVGDSGTGKSLCMSTAADLLSIPGLRTVNLGSGEGVAAAFLDTVREVDSETKRSRVIRRQVRRNVLFTADEGRIYVRHAARDGSTVGEVLRTAWMGSDLGQANANVERNRYVAGGNYAMGFVAGLQMAPAASMLVEQDLGTPQRIVMAPATYPRLPLVTAEWPGPLSAGSTLSLPDQETVISDEINGWVVGSPMDIPAHVREWIINDRIRETRGELVVDPLERHRWLVMLKVAGLLAVLDNRTTVLGSDIELAEVVWTTQMEVRRWLIEEGESAQREAKELVAVERAVMNDPRTRSSKVDEVERLSNRIPLVVGMLADQLGELPTRGQVRKQLNSRYRPYMDAALDMAERRLQLGQDDEIPEKLQRWAPEYRNEWRLTK